MLKGQVLDCGCGCCSVAQHLDNSQSFPDRLPNELMCEILSLLDLQSLCRSTQVCRRWHTLITQNDTLWKMQCKFHCPGEKFIRTDRQLGMTWRAAFIRNYSSVGIKRKWREGEFSTVSSFSDLPAKSMCKMDADTWGEIFQQELDR